MTIRRTVALSCFVLVAGAGLGCSQPAAVLPTDQKAKDLAAQPPPPIIGMSGSPSSTPTNGTAPNTGSAKAAAGKGGKLHGISK